TPSVCRHWLKPMLRRTKSLKAEPRLQFYHTPRKATERTPEIRIGYECSAVEKLDGLEVELIECVEKVRAQLELCVLTQSRQLRHPESLHKTEIYRRILRSSE